MIFAHTFSIVARCPATGQMGVAVQSHWFSVGTVVAWAEAGVGVVATQSLVEPAFGPNGLSIMRGGATAKETLNQLISADEQRDVRQLGIMDTTGHAAAWTGARCVAAAGHYVGGSYSVQANMMTSDKIWPAMASAFETTEGDLITRMLASLDAAQATGGDARGMQSAALVVVKPQSTGKPWVDRLFDLRVDDSPNPLQELRRLVGVQRAYNFMNAGDVALEHKDTAAALAAYSAAEALSPNSAEMVFWHAVALANAGHLDEARKVFKRCFAMETRWIEMTGRVATAGLLTISLESLNLDDQATSS